MLRLVRHIVVALVLVVIAGCAGGGCSSGCSCAGVTPLAEGFDPERRIENVASARLTESGLQFLENNIGTLAGILLDEGGGTEPGVLTFDVPNFSGSEFGISYDLCPQGSNPNADPPLCIAEIDLPNSGLMVDTVDPHYIRVHGPLDVRLQDVPLTINYFGLGSQTAHIVLNKPGSCPGGGQPFAEIDVEAVISVEIDDDVNHSRFGYSKLRIVSIDIPNEDQILDQIEYCDGGFTGGALDFADDFLIGTVKDTVIDALNSELEEAFCQTANYDLDPVCPTGTNDVDGICRFDDGVCASFILGIDGHFNLAQLLAGFSPGTEGAFNFLFALGGHSQRDDGTGHSWGDLNPTNFGASIGLYGGTDPVPISKCVNPVSTQLPTDIPVPDELNANTVSGWPSELDGPHVGFGLSERFTNYMLAQLYNSGALCLGITADALGGGVPLTTTLVGPAIGANSIAELPRMGEAANLAILLRPQSPPTVEFGNGTNLTDDALITVRIERLSFDFYVWSLDRFIRAFSATMDITVPINLEVTPEGLVPVLDQLQVDNASIDNAPLIREDKAAIAASLTELLTGIVGGFLGDALPALNLNEQLASTGLTLTIPPTVEGQGSPGLRKLVKGSDDFLGIFATLGLAQTMPFWEGAPADTDAQLSELFIDPEGLQLHSMKPENAPYARIRLGSTLDNGLHQVEWQHRLDGGLWSPFYRDRELHLKDGRLRLEGKHYLEIRSRVVGQPFSLDPEPAVIELVVDAQAPTIHLATNLEGELVINVRDQLTADGNNEVRVRFADGWADDGEPAWGPWSAWQPADTMVPLPTDDATHVEVEASDGEGNIGVVKQALIRGAAQDAGCECNVVGSKRPTNHLAWLAGLALVGLVVVRRQRSVTARAATKAAKKVLTLLGFVVIGGTTGCSCGDDVATGTLSGCRARGDCKVLDPGLIGSYTSAAVAGDGTVWVAGYLEANHDTGRLWGDLVVGKLVGERVDWQAVDGLPTDEMQNPEEYDPTGFRGGLTGAGDDVGMWTSVAIAGNGFPAVAYYSATHKHLRYASFNGDSWAVSVVNEAPQSDIGRYAKLTFQNGAPVIVYHFIEPQAGVIESGVRAARGSAADAGAAAWSIENVAVTPSTPCRPEFCGDGTVCLAEEGICAATAASCGDCGSDECVDVGGTASCRPVHAGGPFEYPNALGLYTSVDTLPDGSLGVAFYDRIKGNLMAASQTPNGWVTIVVDGEDASGVSTGDVGIGTSLDIDLEGNFHIAYVNGLSEGVQYIQVLGGNAPGTPEVVDDGRYGTGAHLVGDDADIMVLPSGDVLMVYMDATAGQLRAAVGVPNGNVHTWTHNAVDQGGDGEFAGYFPVLVDQGGTISALNFWRVGVPTASGDVRLVPAGPTVGL